MDQYLDWLRAMFTITSVIVAFWLFCMTARHFRKLEIGQKLWATGAIFILIYVADVNWELRGEHLDFKWRLIVLALGLTAYFAYLLEPRRSKIKRFGRRWPGRGDPL